VSELLIAAELSLRNARGLEAWRDARRLSGGRDMADMRDQEQQRRWRVIEFAVRQTGRMKRKRAKVVNMAAWYLRKARKERIAV
jgi:hypothetical protein